MLLLLDFSYFWGSQVSCTFWSKPVGWIRPSHRNLPVWKNVSLYHSLVYLSLILDFAMAFASPLIILFFRHSVAELLLCLGGILMANDPVWPDFQLSNRETHIRPCPYLCVQKSSACLKRAWCPGCVTAKQTQIISPRPLCMKAVVRCLCWSVMIVLFVLQHNSAVVNRNGNFVHM